jgi:lysozyme
MLVIVIAVVMGTGVAALLAWFVLIPQYRPDAKAGEVYGIDVSNHQDDINWKQVANDDIAFAYVKATEGRDFVDRQFTSHWLGARNAGLRTGAYHFFTLCTSGAEQAANFLRVVPSEPDALPPAIDLELAGNCKERPPIGDVHREVNAFITDVETATGKQTLLYVGDDFEDRYSIKAVQERDVWQPQFMRRPGGNWKVWQFTGAAHVDGTKGRIDLNIARPGFLTD